MFGRVSKIPIATAFSELVEIEFADYGDYAAFLHIQGAFRAFPYYRLCVGGKGYNQRKWSEKRRFRIGYRRFRRLELLRRIKTFGLSEKPPGDFAHLVISRRMP